VPTTAAGTVNFDQIIGASATRAAYGVNGSGMTVAVIDMGVNDLNQSLGGGVGPGDKVVFGYDFADGTASAMPANSSEQHGTAVAGLIASNNPSDLGVAPGAGIAALRVANSNDQASFNSISAALQWVIANHTQYNITAVNISLSDGGNYAQNWFAGDGSIGQQITLLIGQLDALNIPVIAATGNSFQGQQGVGFPAIVPDTISVTGTDGSNQLLSDAQRLGTALGGSSATDIAAPAENLLAPSGDTDQLGSVTGTSFAAPLVTGAVVLLQQIYESRFGKLPTVAQLDNWLQQGSEPITDTTTGITIGTLDIPKAAALIPAAPTTPHVTTSDSTPAPTPQNTTGDSNASGIGTAPSSGATTGSSSSSNSGTANASGGASSGSGSGSASSSNGNTSSSATTPGTSSNGSSLDTTSNSETGATSPATSNTGAASGSASSLNTPASVTNTNTTTPHNSKDASTPPGPASNSETSASSNASPRPVATKSQAVPQTQVYINGQVIGSVPTAELGDRWSAMASVFGGRLTSLITWGSPGSTLSSLQNGTSQPQGRVDEFSLGATTPLRPRARLASGPRGPLGRSQLVRRAHPR
jgi:type VI secretion system secreted protein VgrG